MINCFYIFYYFASFYMTKIILSTIITNSHIRAKFIDIIFNIITIAIFIDKNI